MDSCSANMTLLKWLVLVVASNAIGAGGVKQIAAVEGDVEVALVVHTCRNSSDLVPYKLQTLVSTAVWTTERINYLSMLPSLKLGLKAYEVCSDQDFFKVIFDLYQQDDYVLGVISDASLNEKVLQFAEVLETRTAITYRYYSYVIKASLKLLSALGWSENVTVLAPDENVLREFYRYSKREYVCVKDCLVYG